MRMGAPETITLVIGQAADAAAVKNAVASDSGEANMVRTEMVSIGENVSAELTSPNSMFKIAPEGRVVKQMPARGQQVWQWSVEALVPGKHKLTLTVGVPILGSTGEVWQPVLEPRTDPSAPAGLRQLGLHFSVCHNMPSSVMIAWSGTSQMSAGIAGTSCTDHATPTRHAFS
jgi:hypothetical protein